MKRAMILLAATLGVLVLYVDLSGGKFRDRIDRERAMILENRTATSMFYDLKNNLAGLPQPVRKYLQYALGGRNEPVRAVRIKQSGSFRLSEKDSWTPVTANQLLTLGKPAFVWHARLQPHPYVWTESRDILHEGIGKTEHRLYSAFPFPLKRFIGKAADVSALVRYLTEAPWLPAALLPSDHLSWKAIDDRTARATLIYNGYRVSADFTFNSESEITQVTTRDRTWNRSGASEAHPWTARYQRYERHGGIKVPMEMETEWSINGKSFPYARLQVDTIAFEGI
jgi:hypothetical protein